MGEGWNRLRERGRVTGTQGQGLRKLWKGFGKTERLWKQKNRRALEKQSSLGSILKPTERH